MISLRTTGRPRKVSVLEAVLVRIIEDSLKGNTKSATFILNRYGALISGEVQPLELSMEDREILTDFTNRLLTSAPKGPPA